VVELAEAKDTEPLFEALCAGGLDIVEVTLRTPAALEGIGRVASAYPAAFVGAGTVRNTRDAARALDAGARFIVSPGTDPETIAFCRDRGVLVVPGACTPTEVQAALRAGAELVKFFPAEASGGVPFLQALTGPFADVSFVPTGGINASNLARYLSIPQVAACGGSWMAPPALLAAGDFARAQSLTAEAVRIVATSRHHD
jgi:2-dehydro-3-deoxyphosphogluconate aldolase/(4S)-4-hydroxy-2-oxoglutarate aldolase